MLHACCLLLNVIMNNNCPPSSFFGRETNLHEQTVWVLPYRNHYVFSDLFPKKNIKNDIVITIPKTEY